MEGLVLIVAVVLVSLPVLVFVFNQLVPNQVQAYAILLPVLGL
jgi:hypothetical protein